MATQSDRPNVVFVLTDDQGYGDLGCTGNPWIQTPHIDNFYQESVRLTDYHVSPLCTPTRGALMSGKRPVRNGAWATCWGRSILNRHDRIMPQFFQEAGYTTGMFGKWHLGDNYPYRPQDRGFQRVVAHKGGGVGQTPDFWANNYFDDTYFHNGTPQQHEGYCTDVWFDEALTFIEENHDRPFFAYIATNAPHSPYLVAKKYRDLYADNPDIPTPAFYGMITNIDENFGRLRRKLAALGIEDNTILIFMTDNGSSAGARLDRDHFVTAGYNAGMRGMKGSYYDGGHRVPFFIRWPNGNIEGGRDISDLVMHIDLLPTFIDLCRLPAAGEDDFDGTSVAAAFTDPAGELPDRTHFLQYRQNSTPPEKWTNAVINRRWRLVCGDELYDIKADPGQHENIASRHPDVVDRLRGEFETWWRRIEPGLQTFCPISLGNEAENPACLCAMDVMGDVAWNQCHIAAAQRSTGRWRVNVEKAGRYRVTLRRWPEELDLALDDTLSQEEKDKLAPYQEPDSYVCTAVKPVSARLELLGGQWQADVTPDQKEVTFEIDIAESGESDLDAWFAEADGRETGAYYVYVQRL